MLKGDAKKNISKTTVNLFRSLLWEFVAATAPLTN